MRIDRKQRKAIKKYAKLKIKKTGEEYEILFSSLLKIMGIRLPPVKAAEKVNNILLDMNEGAPLKKRFIDGQDPDIAFIDFSEAGLVATLFKKKDMVYYLNRFILECEKA